MNNTMSFTAIAYSFRNSQAYLYFGTGYLCCDQLHKQDENMGCLRKWHSITV